MLSYSDGQWGSTTVLANVHWEKGVEAELGRFGFTKSRTLKWHLGDATIYSHSGPGRSSFHFCALLYLGSGYASRYTVLISDLPSLLQFLKEIGAHLEADILTLDSTLSSLSEELENLRYALNGIINSGLSVEVTNISELRQAITPRKPPGRPEAEN